MPDEMRSPEQEATGLPALPANPGSDLLKSLRQDLAPSLRIMLDERLYEQVKRLAGIMSKDTIFTPRHLVGKAEACFTVITQALNWNIDPQFVARCTYQTPGGSIGFEGKLVQAILEQSGRFVGSPKVTYSGDWSKVIGKFVKATSAKGNEYVKPAWTEKDAAGLGIIVRWQVKGEDEPRVWPGEDEPFYLTQCYPLNSPLWATDARTQIRYLAMRRFADGAAPGILGGMAFAYDDIAEASEILKDVTPEPPPRPRREDFVETKVVDVQESFEVVDMTGTVSEAATAEEAAAVYQRFLDQAEKANGEAGLTLIWDNNQGLMRELDERGFGDLTKDMSSEYGVRRQAAAAREMAVREAAVAAAGWSAVPRGTDAPPNTPAGTQSTQEEKGQSAAVDGASETPSSAGETPPTDLLGDPPAENLTVPLPRNPTARDLEFYARQLIALIEEQPGNTARIAQAAMANEGGIAHLKAGAPDAYNEVQAALTAARKGG